MTESETLALFESTGALLRGHFVLRSGLHSGHFFQCARLGEDLAAISKVAEALRAKLGDLTFETVLAPAMGGLVIGQEVARQSGSRYLFAEKVDDRLAIRRNFQLREGERVLIVEDVITRGGRVEEALALVRATGATPVGVAVIVDRSQGQASFDVPLTALAPLSFPTYEADNLPPDLAALPASKPGS
jgi:orotate phosphoribosyltransferase